MDALWTEFWQGGITNPLTVIEQVTFLMYARLLDINETRDENRQKRTGKSNVWLKKALAELRPDRLGL